MTIPLWCLLVAIILPYPWAMTAMGERKKQFGTADNKNPRKQTAQLEGKGARAYAAHQNALEALPPFGIAVLVAHVTHADPTLSTILAVAWIVARVLHGVFYIADIDKARSGMFVLGNLAVVGQFVISAMAAGVPPHH
ncbi:MAPEG family protein [Chondromyces apiculatus]|uniref:Putative membrane protein n=1 Tax=Chondromyces apiculatus DSM 436 TaxID=1192034 RepID=A0A017T240_9BACT|nr:MAPEG family protein [Chondromyces apiculatus]EYF03339.1 putative membrane protein [Chondromyces apiculatus DSM 436]